MQKLLFLLALAFLLASCSESQKQQQKPNIIFIMADDHAVSVISSYGNSINKIPNIDRLADKGMRFDQSFCTNAICAPGCFTYWKIQSQSR